MRGLPAWSQQKRRRGSGEQSREEGDENRLARFADYFLIVVLHYYISSPFPEGLARDPMGEFSIRNAKQGQSEASKVRGKKKKKWVRNKNVHDGCKNIRTLSLSAPPLAMLLPPISLQKC